MRPLLLFLIALSLTSCSRPGSTAPPIPAPPSPKSASVLWDHSYDGMETYLDYEDGRLNISARNLLGRNLILYPLQGDGLMAELYAIKPLGARESLGTEEPNSTSRTTLKPGETITLLSYPVTPEILEKIGDCPVVAKTLFYDPQEAILYESWSKPRSLPKPQFGSEREKGQKLAKEIWESMKRNDTALDYKMAMDVLQHDPTEEGEFQFGGEARKTACMALNDSGREDEYLADLKKQLTAKLDSLRLTLLTAEVYADEANHDDGGQAMLPDAVGHTWMKLNRQGDLFTAFVSPDGINWKTVITYTIHMESPVLCGIITSPNTVKDDSVSWSDVRISGQITPPWQYEDECNSNDLHGGAQVNGAEITMNSMYLKVETPPFYAFDCHGFFHQKMEGDGEIMGRVTRLTSDPDDHSWTGLCFRSRSDAISPRVCFFIDKKNQALLTSHTDASDQALALFQRAIELAKAENRGVLASEIGRLATRIDLRAAQPLIADGILGDLPRDGMGLINVMPKFIGAGRLTEFVSAVLKWNPDDPTVYRTFVLMASRLRQSGHPLEAEQLYRKALTMKTPEFKGVAAAQLVRFLWENHQQDEAKEEFQRDFLSPTALSQGTSIIDFWSKPTEFYGGKDAPIFDRSALTFLDLALQVGMYEPLRKELLARSVGNVITVDEAVRPARVASLLLAIRARDPAYLAELDSFVYEMEPIIYPGIMGGRPSDPGGVAGANYAALRLVMDELAQWPGHENEALGVAAIQISPKQTPALVFSTGGNLIPVHPSMDEPILEEMMLVSHENVTADTLVLKEVARRLDAGNSASPQLMASLPLRAPIIQEFIRAGLIAEARSAYDSLLDKGSDTALTRQIETELAMVEGTAEPDGLVYGLSPASNSTNQLTFFWQMNSGGKVTDIGNPRISAFGSDLWFHYLADRPTTYRVQIQAGPDLQHMAIVSTVEKAQNNGTTNLDLTGDSIWLQASLLPESGETPLATGEPILYSRAPNLINNADFIPSPSGDVSNWKDLFPSQAIRLTDGPPPSGLATRLNLPVQHMDYGGGLSATSDDISLDPEHDYVFSAWQRNGFYPEFEFLNSQGMPLRVGGGYLRSGGNAQGWRKFTGIMTRNTTRSPGTVSIPEGATAVRISIRSTVDLAQLSLQAISLPNAR